MPKPLPFDLRSCLGRYRRRVVVPTAGAFRGEPVERAAGLPCAVRAAKAEFRVQGGGDRLYTRLRRMPR